MIALRLGCGNRVPGWTVMRNCASGMQALDSAIANIQSGRSQLVVAGGVDALSRAPLLFSDDMVRWLSGWYAARGLGAKLSALRRFKLRNLAPVIGLLKGLTDPVVGLSMGQTAENVATRFGIDRAAMDAYSAGSHQRALAARAAGALAEIVPIIDAKGTLYPEDDGVRADSTPEKLAKLKPVFDKPWGNITAGNSSQVTDGAAMLVLASEEAVQRWNLRPLGRIVDSQWAGLDPAQMCLGPVHAATPILQRQGLGLNDLDLWEINEAFAAQVLGCLAAWRDEAYCQEHFGTPAWGQLDTDRLNIDGGAIAIGHPVGASGARIVLHLLDALSAAAHGAAWPPSALAAAKAAPCWSKPWRSAHEPQRRLDAYHGDRPMSALDTLSHWRLARDPDGLAWLTFDRAASAVNALSADTMAELALVLDALDKDPPGPGDPLGQADRLHRGRRCQRIRQPGHARAGPCTGGARLEPVQPAGRRALSHAGPDPGPLPGRRPGAGAGLPLSPRGGPGRRIAGAARGHAGHLPRLGRHAAAAAPDRRAGRAGHDAHRPGRRRAPRRRAGPGRRARAAAPAGSRRARHGAVRQAGAPDARPGRLDQPLAAQGHRRQPRAQADRGQGSLGHYPAAPAIVTLWEQHDGDAQRAPSLIDGIIASDTARNLLRVFRLQERLKANGRQPGQPRRGASMWSAPASWAATSPPGARTRA